MLKEFMQREGPVSKP